MSYVDTKPEPWYTTWLRGWWWGFATGVAITLLAVYFAFKCGLLTWAVRG